MSTSYFSPSTSSPLSRLPSRDNQLGSVQYNSRSVMSTSDSSCGQQSVTSDPVYSLALPSVVKSTVSNHSVTHPSGQTLS